MPLFVSEASTVGLRALYDVDPALLVWWGAQIECVSAFARLERERKLSASAMQETIRELDAVAASWREVEPGDQLRRTATRLLRVHPLRAADALQLAAAIVGAEGHPASLEVVCLDARLGDAARREGFPILDLAGAV